jgi:rhodanese-related sulfurtransferase
MRVIDRVEADRLASAGGQLVEILAREEFDWAHLPGAVLLPLREVDEHASDVLEAGRPIVAYCNDFL